MKSVLISIRPEWCEKIVNGKKTIEVRKSAPKEVPFKAYIYCTKSRENDIYKRYKVDDIKSGKVIGEFVCDEVEPLTEYEILNDFVLFLEKRTCLSEEELLNYKGKSDLIYGWHISDLKIYDKPKELSEFKTVYKGCKERDTYHCKFYCYGERPLTRPPQSWQYIDEVKE